MKLAKGFRRSCRLKNFSAFSSGSNLVHWSKTISSESPKQHWLNGVGGVIIKIFFFLFLALAAIMFIGVEQFYYFRRESYKQYSCEF